jgi:ABC-2 type transport system ATP-binding protein
MIEIESLSHTYPGTRKTAPRLALDALTLKVETGRFCILAGPNGSGKSTLFRTLSGLMLPSRGTIRLGGVDLFREPEKAREKLGVVFQTPAVDKHLTVAENMRLQGALYGLSGRLLDERMAEALAWSQLKDRQEDRVGALSGGLARQVELAKCLLARPEILVLDEPTTGLDPGSRRAFLDVLHQLHHERGITILMTTHIFSEAEDADQVAILKYGVLKACDTPARLRALLGSEVVVVQAKNPTSLKRRIEAEQKIAGLRLYGDEIRIEGVDPKGSLELLETLLAAYRQEIVSIAIKQPGLEDVFLHVTGEGRAENGEATP